MPWTRSTSSRPRAARGRASPPAPSPCEARGRARTVRLDGHDRDSLAVILATTGDRPVIPGLILGDHNEDGCDLVVHDGPAPHGVSLLVTRPCYLALRRALHEGVTSNVSGVVSVTEPGRALEPDDIAAVLGLPVITTIPVRADIARTVDAGVLAHRLPESLATATSQILRFAQTDTGRQVA